MPSYFRSWINSRSGPSYEPKQYAASKPLDPERHNAQRPSTSSGKRFRKGVLHCEQKWLGNKAAGERRQGAQTGTRVYPCSDTPQMRHSSGKRIEKRAWGTFRMSKREKAAASVRLLEKAHLHQVLISSQKPLLLQFLTTYAMPGPGHCL